MKQLSYLAALSLGSLLWLSASSVYAEPDVTNENETAAKTEAPAEPGPEMKDGELPPPRHDHHGHHGPHGRRGPRMTPVNPPMMSRAPKPPVPACRPRDSFRNFKPSISGGYHKEMVIQTIRDHADEVQACFDLAYSKDPKFEGMVGIQWLLTRKGDVMKVFVKESTIHNEEVEKCLTESIQKWVFPRGQNSGMGQINHWFVFKDGKYQKD